MNYYLSAPETIYKPVREKLLIEDSLHYLLSFATSSKHFEKFYQDGKNKIMIDSGAFSAWNSGKVINREHYLAYCKKLPSDVIKINLDVIPRTGSDIKEKIECCKKSFENYIYLKSHLENVMPVHHYGEDIEWALRMLQETDYIAISPANDTGEPIKRKYFDFIFSQLPHNVKTHALGYSSIEGLSMYPFYSIDSISYKKTHMHGNCYFTRNDGSIIDLDIGDYARHHGIEYDPSKGLVENPLLLTNATYDTIQSLLTHIESITDKNKTKDFSYLKNQPTLF